MTPLSIRLKHFRSFLAEQTFHFPQKPGLYFMQGVNEVEPRLGGNACGKTTIWEALTWCVFGITAEGLKAGDVCHWHEKGGTEVHFIFMREDGEPCKLSRTWGPISWTLSCDEEVIDLTKDRTNPVLESLRLELEPWLSCILTAQGQPMFLDLKADAQANLFSSVLSLDRWLDYSKRSSAKASEQDAVTRELERKEAKLRGELQGLTSRNYDADAERWEEERERRLKALDEEHAEAMGRRKRLKADLAGAEEVLTQARAGLKEWLAENDNSALLHDYQKHWKPAVSDYSQMLREAERDLERKRSEIAHYREASNCPTCGQGLSMKSWHDQRGAAERQGEHLEKQVKRWARELEATREKVAEVEAKLDAAREDEGKLRDLVEGAELAASSARRALDLVERELDRIEDRAEEIEAEENIYANMVREAADRVRRLGTELADTQAALDASNARYGLLSFWVKGFKEVRLQQIAEALVELEVEVNSAVTSLGLVGWELKFAVDREGKGGGIQRGFSVLVKSPHNPMPTPWRAWSGGEKQRLRLAANMGLADLIRSRTGTPLNLEVWDEPTNGLSPEGWTDLLESLAARAQAEQRVIFLTDHKAHDFGGFAGTATVYKRPSGSKAVTTWGGV